MEGEEIQPILKKSPKYSSPVPQKPTKPSPNRYETKKPTCLQNNLQNSGKTNSHPASGSGGRTLTPTTKPPPKTPQRNRPQTAKRVNINRNTKKVTERPQTQGSNSFTGQSICSECGVQPKNNIPIKRMTTKRADATTMSERPSSRASKSDGKSIGSRISNNKEKVGRPIKRCGNQKCDMSKMSGTSDNNEVQSEVSGQNNVEVLPKSRSNIPTKRGNTGKRTDTSKIPKRTNNTLGGSNMGASNTENQNLDISRKRTSKTMYAYNTEVPIQG